MTDFDSRNDSSYDFAMRGINFYTLILAMGIVAGCARSPVKSPEKSMRPFDDKIEINDDLNMATFREALVETIKRFRKLSETNENAALVFGPKTIPVKDYLLALENLELQMHGEASRESVLEYIQQNFQFMEVYGEKKWGDVFVTGYYEPYIPGSLKKTNEFDQALYAVPEDLVAVDMQAFAETFPGKRQSLIEFVEQKSTRPILRGRLTEKKEGYPVRKILPYYSREEIDGEAAALSNSKIELVWVDPIDAFFLHIQGSGTIELSNGKLFKVGYAAQNGHSYVAIGKFLLDDIPLEKMSMQSIEMHLRSLPKDEMKSILFKNPSYIFFENLEGGATGYFGSEVVAGRSIATDSRLFPKGALAFLEFEKPVFESKEDVAPEEFQKTSRFVFDHDTGGAIRGAGRVDLFVGQGAEGAQVGGVMRHRGRLFYLFPR